MSGTGPPFFRQLRGDGPIIAVQLPAHYAPGAGKGSNHTAQVSPALADHGPRIVETMLFPLFFVIPVIIIVLGLRYAQKRRAEQSRLWGTWTSAREWLYHDRWPALVRRFRGGPFGRGSSRKAHFGFEGTFNGLPAIGFNYEYTVSSGKNSTTYRHRILALRIDGARFPRFDVRRRSWGSRGVTFENVVFNKRWRVEAGSQRFAYDFMNPRVMEALLGPHAPFQRMWLEGDHLLVQCDHRTTPDQIDSFLMFMSRILELQPDFLFREVGARPPQITDTGPGIDLAEQRRRISALNYQAEQAELAR